MDSFLLRGVRNPTLLLATLFLPVLATAEDRVLDLSSGCKLYRLEGRAWQPADAGAMDGAAIPGAGVVKDAAFFVFKNASGTYGVNKKCVKPATGSADASQTQEQPAPAARPKARPAAKRASAAKPTESKPLDRKSPWSVAFGFGMNFAPKGTAEITGAVTATQDIKFKSTLAFMGEAGYLASDAFRFNAEIGLSQLTNEDGNGNETSYFALRPDLVIGSGSGTEFYLGPMLGLFFLSQNAQTGTDASGVTTTFKQQTTSSLLLGAKLGADFALSDQFDLGGYFQYFKPGALTLKADLSGAGSGTYDAKITSTWFVIGARFVIHF